MMEGRKLTILGMLLFSFGLTSCVSPPDLVHDRTLTLVYSGNLDGELEPCGCSAEGDLGGIKRRANMVDRLRDEKPDLFLISAGGLLISMMPQDRLTSEYILKGFVMMDYDAIGIQWKDLAFGEDFLRAEKLPWVASNLHSKAFAVSRKIDHNGTALAYLQWLDPAQDPKGQMAGAMKLADSDLAPLAELLKSAKQQQLTTVLATTLPRDEAVKKMPLSDVDILIIKAKYEEYGEPELLNGTLILQPGSRGMRLGRLDLTVDPRGGIKHWQHEVIQLPKAVGDAPRLDAWYEEYNDEVREDYEHSVALRKAMMSGESPYAGEQACKACHSEEHAIWSQSKHSQAFGALEKVNKAFDPACIICHTVGFNRDGGFIDPEITPKLMNVQCESCHGGARRHVAANGRVPVEHAQWPREKICAQCHTQPHSPSFKVGSYWPKIAHGRRQ